MKKDIRNYMPQGGRAVKEDGSVVNWADGINEDGSQRVQLTGSYVRQSTDERPTGKEGDTLYLWDTKVAYIHDGTEWRSL